MQNTGPTILKTPDIPQAASQLQKNPKGFFRRNLFKIIIAALVIGVALELYLGGTSLFSPNKSNNFNILKPNINEMSGARLSLVPERASFKQGETIVVDVKLFTGGNTVTSTDLVVKYDPAYLKPLAQTPVAVGQIFPDYPPVQVEANQGLIGVSGVNFESSQTFSGVGLFAKLNFTALKPGQSNLEIDYVPDETRDSNVIKAVDLADVLMGVDNATINVSDAEGAESQEPQSCGSFTQYCLDAGGASGTQVCNAGTMKDGVCGYDARVTMSCEQCKI